MTVFQVNFLHTWIVLFMCFVAISGSFPIYMDTTSSNMAFAISARGEVATCAVVSMAGLPKGQYDESAVQVWPLLLNSLFQSALCI